MAKFNYTKTASTALRLIDRFGRSLQIKAALNQTGANPGPRYGAPQAMVAAVLPYTRDRDNRIMDIDNISDDELRTLYIAAQGLSITPKTGDVATFDGDDWSVVSSTPLKPADVVVMHTAVVRRI